MPGGNISKRRTKRRREEPRGIEPCNQCFDCAGTISGDFSTFLDDAINFIRQMTDRKAPVEVMKCIALKNGTNDSYQHLVEFIL
mgnify:CR=1 FL=1